MSLETNYTKAQLAEKVRELTEKLKEMRQVESQINASVETLKDGMSAIGVVKDGEKYKLVRIVYDLDKNAAAIISTEELASDHQIAAGKLMKEVGPLFYKAAGIKI